ncbi:hypothetical protein PAXRUDRAFT_13868 [Paxillus rubicundulus Ve08.2h10]|uniref:Uncharacterized protein n=1 Tax=Paxillus rubicundulus Ve08.2h10 TaxID=930991 RepID=A0A0D0E2Y3_9AGAM|nr:hypothetical protein PAXRUDRAFT_13868 [Paxillus rubicundulus Ve08.2h10]
MAQVIRATFAHVANMLQLTDMLNTNTKELEDLYMSSKTNTEASAANDSPTRVEEAADAILSSLEDVKNSIALLTPSLDCTQERINSLIAKTTELTSSAVHSSNSTNPISYSAAVKSTKATMDPMITAMVAKASTRDKQVLIDLVEGQLYELSQSASSIAEQIKKALTSIKQIDSPHRK